MHDDGAAAGARVVVGGGLGFDDGEELLVRALEREDVLQELETEIERLVDRLRTAAPAEGAAKQPGGATRAAGGTGGERDGPAGGVFATPAAAPPAEPAFGLASLFTN